MKYLPNLIPKEYRVLPEYFKEGSTLENTQSPNQIFHYIGGALFLFVALFSLNHFLAAVLFATIGLVILPQGHALLERTLRFKLTTKIKVGICALLFLIQVPISFQYRANEKAQALQLKQDEENALRIKLADEKQEASRKDSLNNYLLIAKALDSANNADEALSALKSATLFAKGENEIQTITAQRSSIGLHQALLWMIQEKYGLAEERLSPLIAIDEKNGELLCNRAICYAKMGNKLNAVRDLKVAMEIGNSKAETLYNQINPKKRRVAYYYTLCCDGSSSSAKGRGACSHHGGVCNWNEPEYEEYREFE